MDIQPLLDRFTDELRRRNLPEPYIARYVDELREHMIDMVEERSLTMSKEALSDVEILARIGAPDSLAEAARIEFSRRSFCGRHPIVMFLVAPIPLTFLGWVAAFGTVFGCVTGVVLLAERLGAASSIEDVGSWPAALVLALQAIFWLGVFGPPTMLNVFFSRLARRNGLNWRWSLAGCALVALFAGHFQAVLAPPVSPGVRGRLMFGFGAWMSPPLQQWLQFAVPLAIGLWFSWRQFHSHPHGSNQPADEPLVNREAA